MNMLLMGRFGVLRTDSHSHQSHFITWKWNHFSFLQWAMDLFAGGIAKYTRLPHLKTHKVHLTALRVARSLNFSCVCWQHWFCLIVFCFWSQLLTLSDSWSKSLHFHFLKGPVSKHSHILRCCRVRLHHTNSSGHNSVYSKDTHERWRSSYARHLFPSCLSACLCWAHWLPLLKPAGWPF